MIDSCSLPKVFSFYEIFWSPGLKKNNIQSRGEPFGILVVFESRGEPFGQNVLLELLFKVGANHSEFLHQAYKFSKRISLKRQSEAKRSESLRFVSQLFFSVRFVSL
jgi:hypothetical protein